MSSPGRNLGILTAVVIVSLQGTTGVDITETRDSASQAATNPPPPKPSFSQSKLGGILTRHTHGRVHAVSGKGVEQDQEENVKGDRENHSNRQGGDLTVGQTDYQSSQENRDDVPSRYQGEDALGPDSRNKGYADTDGVVSGRNQGGDAAGGVTRNTQGYSRTGEGVSGSHEGVGDVSGSLQGNGGTVDGVDGKTVGGSGAAADGAFTGHGGQGRARDNYQSKRGFRRHHNMHGGRGRGTHDQNRRRHGWGGRGENGEGNMDHNGRVAWQRMHGRRRHFMGRGGRGRDGESHQGGDAVGGGTGKTFQGGMGHDGRVQRMHSGRRHFGGRGGRGIDGESQQGGDAVGGVSRNQQENAETDDGVSRSHQGVGDVSGSLQRNGGAVDGIDGKTEGGAGVAAEGAFTGRRGQGRARDNYQSKRGFRWHHNMHGGRGRGTHDQNRRRHGWGGRAQRMHGGGRHLGGRGGGGIDVESYEGGNAAGGGTGKDFEGGMGHDGRVQRMHGGRRHFGGKVGRGIGGESHKGGDAFKGVSRNQQEYAETDNGVSGNPEGEDVVGPVSRTQQGYAETDGGVSGSHQSVGDVSESLQGNGGAVDGIDGKTEGGSDEVAGGKFTGHGGQGRARHKYQSKRGSRWHHKMLGGRGRGSHDQNLRRHGWGGRGKGFEGAMGHDGRVQRMHGGRRHFGGRGGRGRDVESHQGGDAAEADTEKGFKGDMGHDGRAQRMHGGMRHFGGKGGREIDGESYQGGDALGGVLRNQQKYAETDDGYSGSRQGVGDVSGSLQRNGVAVDDIAGKTGGGSRAAADGAFTGHGGQGRARDTYQSKRGSRWHHKMHGGRGRGSHDQNLRRHGWGGRGKDFEGDMSRDGRVQKMEDGRRHFGGRGARGIDGERNGGSMDNGGDNEGYADYGNGGIKGKHGEGRQAGGRREAVREAGADLVHENENYVKFGGSGRRGRGRVMDTGDDTNVDVGNSGEEMDIINSRGRHGGRVGGRGRHDSRGVGGGSVESVVEKVAGEEEMEEVDE